MNVLKQMPNRSGPDVFFSFPGVNGSVRNTDIAKFKTDLNVKPIFSHITRLIIILCDMLVPRKGK